MQNADFRTPPQRVVLVEGSLSQGKDIGATRKRYEKVRKGKYRALLGSMNDANDDGMELMASSLFVY